MIPWCPPTIIIVVLIEISTLSEKNSGNIQLINNSDKGSGNTLQLSSQATENKSKVHSIWIVLNHDIKRKEICDKMCIRDSATSALEMSQNSERLSWTFEEVDGKLKGIMETIYANISDAAKDVYKRQRL